MVHTFIALVVLALVAVPALAGAITVDFSTLLAPPGGNLGTATTTTGGIQIDAYQLSGSAYVQTGTTIFVRNEAPKDTGVGVCNSGEQASSACAPPATFTGGGGDINELDNAGTPELIRLTLPEGFSWLGVSVSSLDCNSLSCTADPESGQLWFSNSDGLATGDLGTLFTGFTATSNDDVNLDIALTGPAATARFLYFIPFSGSNNDYLVWRADIEEGGGGIIETSAPGTLVFLGLGLVALVVGRRVRRD